MADDILTGDELGVFLSPAVVEMAAKIAVGEITDPVFVLQADTPEDHRNETNLHKRVAMISYARYEQLLNAEAYQEQYTS